VRARRYEVWTWGETPHPRNPHVGLGSRVGVFRTYEAAVEYALRWADDYDGGLYVLCPDGVVDVGDRWVYPDGTIEEMV
jgi:hypothetical protein